MRQGIAAKFYRLAPDEFGCHKSKYDHTIARFLKNFETVKPTSTGENPSEAKE